MKRSRHITTPAGFAAAGVACGIKSAGTEDLSLVAARNEASAAIATTRNQVVGAPVLWCRRVLPRGYGKARAIVINSGNSNVCTGRRGLRDAEAMARLAAERLGTAPEKVLVASTGLIGRPLPMGKVRRGIARAGRQLGRGNDGAALRGIMTTDTREKSALVQTRIGRKDVTVAGMAKGAGMIAPSVATMIAVLTTDAAVSPPALGKALRQAVRHSFNAITIDSDTSTSDTVALLASGEAGNARLTARSGGYPRFAAAVGEVCDELARAMVADGEGATKVLRIAVRGARSDREAEAAAKAVANSPLVKCAAYGSDPNWGRIVAALGKSPARVDPQKLSVSLGGVRVFAGGVARKFDRRKVARHFAGETIEIHCDLALGRGAFTALTCDLSHQYVTINAEYPT